MKLRSTRIHKSGASVLLQPDSRQRISVPPRQSPRLAAKLRSVSILHGLETNCKPQTLFEQLPTQKRRSVDAGAERPLKRARLTEKNLGTFEKMGGRQRKSAGKSTGQSSTTTTTNKDFGTKLQQNNIVYTAFDARAPDDIDDIRALLDQPRESPPPELLDYQRYLVVTEDYENELGVEISAYPLLAKRTAREVEISGYFQRLNHAWSAVDNYLTTGLSDPQPDLVESFRKTDYPLQTVEALSADLAPSLYNEAMPTYAVEFKSSNGDMKEAKLQCAFDGSIMTEGALAVHRYMKKPDDDFFGKTQALTLAFNGGIVEYYSHHALQTPGPSQLAADGAAPNDAAGRAGATVKHHPFLTKCDTPRASFENFQEAYKHVRNAQKICYEWARKRREELCAHHEDNTQTSALQASNNSWATPDDHNNDEVDPTPAQQPTDPMIPVSSGLPDGFNHDDDDKEDEDSMNQLLRESLANSTAKNLEIAPVGNGNASLDTQTYNPVTPPRSSHDLSFPLNSVEDIDDSNVRGHRKTRLARARAVDPVKGRRKVDHISKSRKIRRKR